MHLSPQSLDATERRLYSQVRQMLTRAGLLRGSLIEMRRRCGKAGCRCAGLRRDWHRSLVLKVAENGKQRTIYIPAQWEDRVRTWAAHYAEIREVLDQLSQACLKRVESRGP